MYKDASPAEWRWAGFATLLVVLLASLPVLTGALHSDTGNVFIGAVTGLDDSLSYMAKMRSGADGAWLFTNRYAIEPHRPGLLYLHYLLLGKLAGPEPTRVITVYQLARALAGVLYGLTTYAFVARILPEVGQRRWAWLFIQLASGLGLVLSLATGEALPFGNAPLGLYLNEAFSFVMLMNLPHTPFARSMLLIGLLAWLDTAEGGPWQRALVASGAWLLASVALPLELPVAAAAVGGYLTVGLVQSRRVDWRAAGLALAASLPAAAYLLTTVLWMRGDAVYAAWNAQNSLPLPHPLHWLASFGMPVALALVGARARWHDAPAPTRLAVGWALLGPLLVLAPVNLQLRLIEAWSLPLWVLATAGLASLLPRLRTHAIASGALLVLLSLNSVLLVVGGTARAAAVDDQYFISGDEADALRWLDANAPPGAVVFASEQTGLLAPAWADVRSVLGHGFETPYFDQKQADVAAFFASDETTDTAHAALLTRYAPDYVFAGPNEAALGDASPNLPSLRPVFTSGTVTIFEVAP